MNRRSLSVFWLVLALGTSAIRGEEKPKMYDRVIRTPTSSFSSHQNDGRPDAVQLAPTADGEARYDILAWLEGHGVEKKAVVAAIALEKSNLVVIRGTPEALDIAERILESCCIESNIKVIELGARIWEYEDDPEVEPHKKPRTVAELRERAGESLRLLDVVSVVTKSGNRVVGENRQENPDAKTGAIKPRADKPENVEEPADPFKDGAWGSLFEAEPNIGPDGATIDFQMAYQCRFPQTGGPDLVMKIHTNGTVHDLSEVVYYSAITLPAAKKNLARFRAVTVSARLFDDKGILSNELADARAKREAGAVKRAFEGLNLDKK